MITTLVAAAALAVALTALLRDSREHRKSLAQQQQGLEFEVFPRPHAVRVGDGPMVKDYEMSLEAAGPGTRYDVQTRLWVDNLIEPKWRDKSQSLARFDNTSAPITVVVQMPTDVAERVWFGISFVDTSLRGPFGRRQVLSNYVRTNVGNRREDERRVQVWHWHRCRRLRAWWQGQSRTALCGGGLPRPLGKWKDVPLRPLRDEHFPVWDGIRSDET